MGLEREDRDELLEGAPDNLDLEPEDAEDLARELAERVIERISARVRVGLACSDPDWVLRMLERIDAVIS